jgi:hypothetical protein
VCDDVIQLLTASLALQPQLPSFLLRLRIFIGYSALKEITRDGFAKLIAAIEAGQVDVVIVCAGKHVVRARRTCCRASPPA